MFLSSHAQVMTQSLSFSHESPMVFFHSPKALLRGTVGFEAQGRVGPVTEKGRDCAQA